jgi:adenosine/AMP kinase
MELKVQVLSLDKDEIINILSGFYHYSNYWVENLDWNADAYVEAKEELEKESTETVAFEEILTRILQKDGHILIKGEEDIYPIYLKNIVQAVEDAIEVYGININPENWDAADADIIMQVACFGEVIYG